MPALAQTSKVFRDGNSWVEETTGTLPPGREFRALTDLGSVEVQGTASQVTYVVRKRSNESTEALARKQFEQLRITASKVGDAVVLEGRMMSRGVNRMAADFVVQIPRLTQMVKAETHGGALSFGSIQGAVLGFTAGGAVKVDDIGGTVKLTSGGGAIDAGTINSDMFLQSGGGAISVQRVSGQLVVKTGGGKVKIGTSGPTTIETGAGNIEVMKCNGELKATSGGGNLNFGEIAGNLTAETSGGSVRLSSAQGNVRVVTGGGSVELWKLGQGAIRGDWRRSDHGAVRWRTQAVSRVVPAYRAGQCGGVLAARPGCERPCFHGDGEWSGHQVGVSGIGDHLGRRTVRTKGDFR